MENCSELGVEKVGEGSTPVRQGGRQLTSVTVEIFMCPIHASQFREILPWGPYSIGFEA